MQKSLTCLLVGEEEEEGEEEVVGERRFQLSVHPVNVLHRERVGRGTITAILSSPKVFYFFLLPNFFLKCLIRGEDAFAASLFPTVCEEPRGCLRERDRLLPFRSFLGDSLLFFLSPYLKNKKQKTETGALNYLRSASPNGDSLRRTSSFARELRFDGGGGGNGRRVCSAKERVKESRAAAPQLRVIGARRRLPATLM